MTLLRSRSSRSSLSLGLSNYIGVSLTKTSKNEYEFVLTFETHIFVFPCFCWKTRNDTYQDTVSTQKTGRMWPSNSRRPRVSLLVFQMIFMYQSTVGHLSKWSTVKFVCMDNCILWFHLSVLLSSKVNVLAWCA
jgi:hypothetical protein